MAGVRSSHAMDHVLRVRSLALHLGLREGARLDVVEAAALLHDVGRQAEEDSGGRICHASAGAVIASQLLCELGVDPELVSDVVHCVSTHRFRGQARPASLEAMVLFDADKLDSIGAVGLGRAFLFAGEVGARLYNPEVNPQDHPDRGPEDSALREFVVKLRYVKDRMFTPTGRAIAAGRHAFMEIFFEQMDAEVRAAR